MVKTFCFKLYRSKRNRKLDRLIDIAGLIYNHCIALHKRYYRLYRTYLDAYRLKRHLTKLKRTKRFGFFSMLGSQAVQDIALRIDKAFAMFFENRKKPDGPRRKISPPNFKRVNRYKSFTLYQAGWKLDEESGTIIIQKRRYRYDHHRKIEGRVKTVTVKRDPLGDIYIYLACDTGAQEVIERTGKSVGYDFGLKKFLTASDGHDIESPLFFRRNSQRIRKLNKALSVKKAGSNRRKRAKIELARLHKRMADQRKDFHHKTAKAVCDEYAVVCLETLNISGMMKRWGRKICDLAFYSLVQILKYHASKTGTKIVEIPRNYPSSQLCSECGYRNTGTKDLRVRRWKCPVCGAEHDRDRNAAVNILRAGASVHAGESVRRSGLPETAGGLQVR